MKASITLLLLVITVGTSLAQSASDSVLVSKRGVPILPQKGDWAIGLDATPFFEYLGNMFKNTANNSAPYLSSPLSPSLVGKYMKNAQTAYRIRVSLNNSSSEGKNQVDDSSSPVVGKQVTDKKTYGKTDMLFGAGLEKRRGKGRLQGIYGIEVFVGFSSTTSTYEYGNAISTATPFVALTIWDPNSALAQSVVFADSRVLENSTGTSISFGVKGFVGVEYFIAPKVSLGGELGYSISSSGGATGTRKDESFDFVSNSVIKTTNDSFSSPSTFAFGTVPTGNIFLSMYF